MKHDDTFESRRRALLQAAGAAAVLLPFSRAGLAAEPAKPKELIVRVWGGEWKDAIDGGVSKGFTKATGIAIKYDETEDNELQPKLWAAVKQKRRPPVAVNWDTTTNATKSALKNMGEDLGDLTNLKGLLPVAKPLGFDGWPLVNVYSYVYVLAYRTEAFPGGAPKSWSVLLDPKIKGRIALYNDGIGFHPAAQVAGGGKVEDIPKNMKACWDFIAKLKAQKPLLGEDPDFTNWFQKGEIDLACTIVTNARGAKKNGVKVAWTIPQEGAKVDTDALWIPKGLPANEVYWAKQYVNYALTAEAQQGWCDGLGLPGVNPNIKPPADMVGDPAYPTKPEDFAKLLRVPNKIQVENEKEWFGKFKKIMQS
ncbi:MAG: PotD/PotF family extracellular solute-binding protein [Betaproteobacteria bacterium]